MKKIFLLIAATICCMNISAQHLQIVNNAPAAPAEPISVINKVAPRRITPASTSPITKTPAGDLLTDVVWSSMTGAPSDGKVVWSDMSGVTPSIIVDGNKMYICSPLSSFAGFAKPWIEGTISGETVTFPTPQAYYMDMSTGTMTYLTRLDPSTGRVNTSNLNITFSYKDGNLTQTDGGVLALTNIDGGFYGYAEMNIKVEKLNDEAVQLPAGAELKSYLMTFDGTQKQTAKVAFVGKDVYISDPLGVENAWMKGTLEGNTISIPTKQYMGSGSGFPLYVQSGQKYTYTETNMMGQLETKIGYKLLDDASINFTYDAATGSFSTTQILLMNAGKNELGSAYMAFENASYAPWTQVKATPANPGIAAFQDLTPYIMLGYRGCLLGLVVPNNDVDGNFIAQEDIYYELSFDGKIVEVYGVSKIPYYTSLADNENSIYISNAGNAIQFQYPITPSKSISIQSFYVVGDEVGQSDVITYNIVDGQLEPVDAIERVEISTLKSQRSMFNLNGQQVGNDYKGIVIKNGKKILKK